MGETTGEIERHISNKRQDLDNDIHELRHKVRSAVDWRVQVQERPLVMLGLAFGVGVVASLLAGSRPSGYGWRVNGRIREQWNAIVAAIGAAVLTDAKDFVKQLIPRFGEEYERRESERGDSRRMGWSSRAEAERQGSAARFAGEFDAND